MSSSRGYDQGRESLSVYGARGGWFRGPSVFVALGSALVFTALPGCSNRSSDAGPPSLDAGPATMATCRDGDHDRQRYGSACLCCHKDTFGVAGSVAHDAGVALVKVRDRDGKIAEMYVNTYDNFFQHRRLTPPISAVIVFEDGTERAMPEPAPHASCNACHGQTTPLLGAPAATQ